MIPNVNSKHAIAVDPIFMTSISHTSDISSDSLLHVLKNTIVI